MRCRIEELRTKAGMTKKDLAQKAGITRCTIWKLEKNPERSTTTRTLKKLAQALCVPSEELFYDEKV